MPMDNRNIKSIASAHSAKSIKPTINAGQNDAISRIRKDFAVKRTPLSRIDSLAVAIGNPWSLNRMNRNGKQLTAN